MSIQSGQRKWNNLYKYGSGLSKEVIKVVKPEYVRLSDPSLLEKCLHGKTQNQNQALNALIWQRVPKEVFVHRDIFELGVYDAVSHFNDGCSAVIEILKSLNVNPGKYTDLACKAEDGCCVALAEHKSTPKAKKEKRDKETKEEERG